MKLFDVKGKRAIVTGGSRGLGGAMAAGLMEHGCKVAVIAASPQTAERVAAFARARLGVRLRRSGPLPPGRT